MTRSVTIQSRDEELENARVERDIIEGQKNTLQTEVLGIAKNKQDLEANFEFAKRKLDEEFTNKKEILDQEIKKLEGDCVTLRNQKIKFEAEINFAIQEKEKAINDKEIHQKEAKEIFTKKDVLSVEHLNLVKSTSELNQKINELKPTISTLEIEKSSLSKEVFELATERDEISTNIIELKNQSIVEEKKLKIFTDENSEVTKNLDEGKKTFEEIKTFISQAQAELLEVQKKVADHTQKMQDREGEVNVRMGNLIRLENRVDEKMERLSEAKKEFTTEHLSRMGIKD